MLSLAWMLSARERADLAKAAGLAVSATTPGLGGQLLSYVEMALALLALYHLMALLSWGVIKLTGTNTSYRAVSLITAYSLTPLFLGRALGLLLLTIIAPLADNSTDALALYIAPAPLGLGALAQPLTLPWMVLSFVDVFTLWTVALYFNGLRSVCGLERGQPGWTTAALVLSWLLILTAVWQGIRGGLA
jgi:Yip1 domain